jgi:hypothetical protein
VLAWHPELGTWEVSTLEHDPAAPRLHALAWPELAMLIVEPELPEDVRGEELEAAVLTPSFHRNGLGPLGTDNALRMLPWSEDERAFVGTLAPGTYSLLVRGAGLAEYRQVTLAAGELHTLALKPWRGIEATVFFELLLDPPDPLLGRSRALLPAESVQLEVLTPTGSTTLELPASNQKRVEGGFELQLWLPCAATELRARTWGGPNAAPRQGRCVLEPGSLDATDGRPRIRISLTSAP